VNCEHALRVDSCTSVRPSAQETRGKLLYSAHEPREVPMAPAPLNKPALENPVSHWLCLIVSCILHQHLHRSCNNTDSETDCHRTGEHTEGDAGCHLQLGDNGNVVSWLRNSHFQRPIGRHTPVPRMSGKSILCWWSLFLAAPSSTWIHLDTGL